MERFLLYPISFISTNSLVNQYKITQSPIPEKLIPNQPIKLLVAHPRSVKNAYQFLEGTSFIAHIALHPEVFPAVFIEYFSFIIV